MICNANAHTTTVAREIDIRYSKSFLDDYVVLSPTHSCGEPWPSFNTQINMSNFGSMRLNGFISPMLFSFYKQKGNLCVRASLSPSEQHLKQMDSVHDAL